MNIDLDLDGDESLRATFEDLETRGESDAVWVTGTDREYGVILEMGRGPIEAPEGSAIPIETEGGLIFRKSVSGHPPYPWFRPAIRAFKADPEGFILDNTDFGSIDDIETTDELVATVAVALQNQMENNVSANTSSDRSPGTHPEHPQRDTGSLVSSISATRIS